MKIKRSYVDYLDEYKVGSLVFNIETNEYGFDEQNSVLVETAVRFKYVCIKPAKDVDNANNCTEPLKQSAEVLDFCKNLQKLNPLVKVLLFTDGIIKPSGFHHAKNIEYVIKVPDKGIHDISDRINENVWKWYIKIGANFVFNISSVDIEEVNIIVNTMNIKKHNVFINLKDIENFEHVKVNEYNLYITMEI